jgi:hypothetical protein
MHILTRVFELREELYKYFKEHGKAYFASCFEDDIWLSKLAYLADNLSAPKQAELKHAGK